MKLISAGVLADPLEQVDTEKSPPCEVLMEDDMPCGNLSTCRVQVRCPVHGTELSFNCDRCLKWTMAGETTCTLDSPECGRDLIFAGFC